MMTTPNVLILAKIKESPMYEEKILSLFQKEPHIILENKGKIELDVLKDFASKIRLSLFEAADRSFFRKRHNAVKTIRIMRDSLLYEYTQRQSNLLVAHFIDKVDPYTSPIEDYNRSIYDMCSHVYNAVSDGGSIAVFCVILGTDMHMFLTGTDASLAAGTLNDVIPTLLDLIGLAKPEEMKGTSIII